VVAAELAALAVWRTLDVGDRIGGLVFNEVELVEIRPHRSQTRAMALLHEVVRLNQRLTSVSQAVGEVTLNGALEAARRLARHDYLVVLISDLDGVNDETRRIATELAAHNDVLIVLVYDPLGNALVMSGSYDAAIAAYDKALKQRPDWTDALENRGLAAARAKRTEEKGGDIGDQKIGAEKIVFDENKEPPGGQETEVAGDKR
jgi:uncharacterized protein (DUF58 family)